MQPTLRRMAGHNHGMIHADPAIIKWATMTTNRHKYFRWTRRTAWITFAYVALVPGLLGAAGYWAEGRWDMRGKRRGDTISEF
ncbi:hypothetical protein GGP41_006079 [Bipolaris sorokiniana]|uniref:Complex I-B15 n=2 Tax=Cochliobolus sativus TaxID=45130 RepID=A0A8H5ZGZ6_COCSA|nr:uncharacterized protein COCSADRAFT_41740 [Bipolaris sorokiniana ND90Pr]EMD58625.1 hypothetical protein COCSADRAFT_41740 [Bipolaris sorokiniana ND90Pr]KAF5849117.1 hypothetical protein GGP41_006079 [Bipolaris sorokiniana]